MNNDYNLVYTSNAPLETFDSLTTRELIELARESSKYIKRILNSI